MLLKFYFESIFDKGRFSLLLAWIQLLNCSPFRVSFGFKYSTLLRLLLFLSMFIRCCSHVRVFASQLTDSCWWCAWFDYLNFRFYYSSPMNLWKVFCWMKDYFINFDIKKSILLRIAMDYNSKWTYFKIRKICENIFVDLLRLIKLKSLK